MGVLKIFIEIADYFVTILFGWFFSDLLIQFVMHCVLSLSENNWGFYTILFTFSPDLTKYRLAFAIIKNAITNLI